MTEPRPLQESNPRDPDESTTSTLPLATFTSAALWLAFLGVLCFFTPWLKFTLSVMAVQLSGVTRLLLQLATLPGILATRAGRRSLAAR